VSDEGVFRTDCSSSVTRLIVERQTANLSRINGNSDQNTEQRNDEQVSAIHIIEDSALHSVSAELLQTTIWHWRYRPTRLRIMTS